MSTYHENSIFWIETNKIRPNPFQPRKEFNEAALQELAESIRQYGVLQPLVVTRKEEQRPDGGISVYYELIAGERRLRAAKLAGLDQVPVIIRKDADDKLRLELAIIENLQREDLNAVDRALAFERLKQEFNLTNAEIGRKIGKSRVYVSNTLRILGLPEEIKSGLIAGKISEGHTRPLLMLSDRPEEQMKLYHEIVLKNLSVREAEKIARKIAQDRVRKKKFVVDPRIREYEKRLSDNLGTRVQIEPREKGGKILIDYFSVEDLEKILNAIQKVDPYEEGGMMEHFLTKHQSLLEELSSEEERSFGQKVEEEQNEERDKLFDQNLQESGDEIGGQDGNFTYPFSNTEEFSSPLDSEIKDTSLDNDEREREGFESREEFIRESMVEDSRFSLHNHNNESFPPPSSTSPEEENENYGFSSPHYLEREFTSPSLNRKEEFAPRDFIYDPFERQNYPVQEDTQSFHKDKERGYERYERYEGGVEGEFPVELPHSHFEESDSYQNWDRRREKEFSSQQSYAFEDGRGSVRRADWDPYSQRDFPQDRWQKEEKNQKKNISSLIQRFLGRDE